MESSRGDRLILGLLVALVAAFGYIVIDTMRVKITDTGDTAPSFSIKTDSGHTITPKDFGGKVLVLNFWATWCPPCVTETPSLVALSKEFGSKGVVVLGVSIDSNEQAYRQFIKRFGIPYETARDPDANISADYGTFKIPETYIIDRNGKVVQKVISDTNWVAPEMLRSIEKLL